MPTEGSWIDGMRLNNNSWASPVAWSWVRTKVSLRKRRTQHSNPLLRSGNCMVTKPNLGLWFIDRMRLWPTTPWLECRGTRVGAPLDPHAECGLRFFFCRVVGGTDDARIFVPDGW